VHQDVSISAAPLARRIRQLLHAGALLSLPLCSHALTNTQGHAVQMGGTVSAVYVDDLANQSERIEYHLEDAKTHRLTKLQFDGEAPAGLKTGKQVAVTGDGSIQLASSDPSAVQAAPMMQTATAQSTAAATVVSGVQNTLVILANFNDGAVEATPAQVQNIMFSDPNGASIDALFRETSFGNVGFSGQVAGPFTINYSLASSCDIAGWANAADAAATASGINIAAYPRHLYVMPKALMNVCGDGAGQVGGSPSRAWVFNNLQNDTYAHELGHNLNMGHASTLQSQYGDASDDMSAGGYALRHFNAPHMEQMGWTPPSNILTVAQSGTYTVAALETQPGQAPAPQMLKIAKPDTGEYYYLSYRQPVGLDSGLRTGYWNRVHVHKYPGTFDSNNTYLLALLDDASVYNDATNGITVTQLSHASDRATVQIQLAGGGGGTGTCQQAAPVVALSPSSQSGAAGNKLSYTVTLSNKDNSYCATSTFNLAGAVPAGWTGSVSPTSLSLAPGSNGTATLSVTSPASAAAATYSAQLNVSDAASGAHTASGSVSYVVQAPACTRAAPAITFTPTSRTGTAGTSLSYTVAIANRDSSACAASSINVGSTVPAGWATTLSPTTMSLSPGATSNATFVVTPPDGTAANTYSVQVSTSDTASAAHSASGSATSIVQAPVADTQAPSAPSSLTASTKKTQISLSWKAATDNVGVTGYEVWRNGSKVASTAATSYSETLASGTYTYSVIAYDAAGNRSAASNSVSVTTKGR
jgi:hypothetical protein